MDGDDVAYPSRLEHQGGHLDVHPEVGLVRAWMIVFGSGGKPLGKRISRETHEEICSRPSAGFPLAHPTFVGRIGWFRRFRYDGTLRRAQDQELLLRAFRSSRFANVPEILLGYLVEKVRLKGTLASRLGFAKAAARESLRTDGAGLAMRVVAEQLLKAAVDCVAAGTGLGHRLLRHRARPVTEQERAGWERVWCGVARDGQRTCVGSTMP
jgi:hypothetical protein